MRIINNDIKIIDNFLPESLANLIENYLTTQPHWLYNSYTSNPDEVIIDNTDNNIKETPQFVHPIFQEKQESEFYETMKSVLFFVEDKFKTKILGLNRIKANLLVPNGTNNPNLYHIPHIDEGDTSAYSILYYVNDSDGDTVFFDKTVDQGDPYNLTPIHRETPKKNTVILFPSKRFHASSNPVNSNVRMVVNTVVTLK